MKALVEFIVRGLVDAPDAVAVTEVVGERTSAIELRVAAHDLGKVIGRQGRTARSLRAIVAAAGLKAKKRVGLEIVE